MPGSVLDAGWQLAIQKLSENNKVLTSDRSLLSDYSINAVRLTKVAIRVTGSGHAYKMPITHSLMQARRSAYAVYTKRMEEEKAKKKKDMQHTAKLAKEDQDTQTIIKIRFRSTQKHHKGTCHTRKSVAHRITPLS